MNETAGYIFLFLNTRNKKENSRAFVSKWKTSDWTQVKARAVSRSPIVSAGISQSGKLLGVAFADFSIGVIGADKLELLYQVPNAHGFAITNLVFTRETGQSKKPVLVSSSVEATIALTSIPDAQSGASNHVERPCTTC